MKDKIIKLIVTKKFTLYERRSYHNNTSIQKIATGELLEMRKIIGKNKGILSTRDDIVGDFIEIVYLMLSQLFTRYIFESSFYNAIK